MLNHEQEIRKALDEINTAESREKAFARVAKAVRKAYEDTGKDKKQWGLSLLDKGTQEAVKEANAAFYKQIEGLIISLTMKKVNEVLWALHRQEFIDEACFQILKDFPFYNGGSAFSIFVEPRIKHAITKVICFLNDTTRHENMIISKIKKLTETKGCDPEDLTLDEIQAGCHVGIEVSIIAKKLVLQKRRYSIEPIDYIESVNYEDTPESIVIRQEEIQEAANALNEILDNVSYVQAKTLYLCYGLEIKPEHLDKCGYPEAMRKYTKIKRTNIINHSAILRIRKYENKHSLTYPAAQ